jgi:hypothetical protein
LNRIIKQAKKFNIFDGVTAANENSLNSDFRNQFKDHLTFSTRGYGYWCWKPQIILQEFERMAEGDMLLYVDAGCHLNLQGKTRLLEYFRILRDSKNGILAFQAIIPDEPLLYDGRKLFHYPTYMWTKGDLLDYFGVRGDKKILEIQTYGAGIILLKKCKDSITILKKWIEVYSNDFSLISDSPSKSPNLDGFVEHRHDQAIFSMLCILNDVDTISAYEYSYPKVKSFDPDWYALRKFPIHAKRDKNLGLFGKILKITKKSQIFLIGINSDT